MPVTIFEPKTPAPTKLIRVPLNYSKGGAKPRREYKTQAENALAMACPIAVDYLVSITKGKVKKISGIRVDVAKYIIDQVIGKATQRMQVNTPADAISYDQITRSAHEALKRAKEDGVDIMDEAEKIVKRAREAKESAGAEETTPAQDDNPSES